MASSTATRTIEVKLNLADAEKIQRLTDCLLRFNVFLEEVDNYCTSTLDLGLEALVGSCLTDLKAMS